jgi:hypothetical protein
MKTLLILKNLQYILFVSFATEYGEIIYRIKLFYKKQKTSNKNRGGLHLIT